MSPLVRKQRLIWREQEGLVWNQYKLVHGEKERAKQGFEEASSFVLFFLCPIIRRTHEDREM